MAVNTVNTRLILRNDALSSWNNSDKILLKGEAALALHTANDDVYKNRYEIRIGDGEHAFSALAPTNIVFPWEAISGAPAAATYELSVSDNAVSACVISTDVNNNTVGRAGSVFSLQTLSDEISSKVVVKEGDTTTAVSQLVINKVSEDAYAALMAQSAICADQIYSITGNTSSINNFGMPLISVASPSADSPDHWAATKGYVDGINTSINNQITGISDAISNASNGLSAQVTAISNDIYTAGTGLSAQVTANTTNISSLSTALTATTGLCARVTALENATTRGVNFIGHVSSITNGQNNQAGTYVLVDGGEPIAAGAGNIVILSGVEYIYSDVSQKWEQFGDEGNLASKSYVDDAKDAAISTTQNTYYTAVSIDQLTDYNNYVVGDVAVISSEIGTNTGKYQYTAYYYAGNSTWRAMDGNYDAENVYFNENLTYTNAIGAIAAPTGGQGTLETNGKSLEEVLSSLLNKEQSGTKTNPSITIGVNTATVEYGTVCTPSYKFTFNPGSYQYGPDPTGVELCSWTVKTNGNALTIASKASTISNGLVDGDLTCPACNPATITATFANNAICAAIYEISAKVTHSAGDVPNTNMGNPDSATSSRIAENTNLSAKRALYNVYKPRYVMFTNSKSVTAPTQLAASDLSGSTTKSGASITCNAANTWYKLVDGTWPTKIYIDGGQYVDIFFVAPSGLKNGWSAKKSDNVNVLNTPSPTNVSFTYLNNEDATYKLYSITNADTFNDTYCNITWS